MLGTRIVLLAAALSSAFCDRNVAIADAVMQEQQPPPTLDDMWAGTAGFKQVCPATCTSSSFH